MLCKRYSATAKTLVCYQHCFNHKPETYRHTSYYEEKLCPGQNQYNRVVIILPPESIALGRTWYETELRCGFTLGKKKL